MPEGPLRFLMVADAVVIPLGVALVIGSMASQLWLWGRTSSWRGDVLRQELATRRFGFALTLAGLVAAPWFEAAVIAEVPLMDAAPTVVSLLGQTHFGKTWLVGSAAWLVSGALLLSRRSVDDRPVRLAAGALSVALLLAMRSVVSHAGSRGDATLDVAVDWLHLAVVSLWVGIVWTGARLALPSAAMPGPSRNDAIRWVRRLSTTATAALVLVVATGLFKAWRAFEPEASIRPFVDSPYGQALAVKLVFVAVAVALGGANRFRVLPALLHQLATADGDEPWRRRLIAILRFEALTLLLVLVAAAVLSATEPPGEA